MGLQSSTRQKSSNFYGKINVVDRLEQLKATMSLHVLNTCFCPNLQYFIGET